MIAGDRSLLGLGGGEWVDGGHPPCIANPTSFALVPTLVLMPEILISFAWDGTGGGSCHTGSSHARWRRSCRARDNALRQCLAAMASIRNIISSYTLGASCPHTHTHHHHHTPPPHTTTHHHTPPPHTHTRTHTILGMAVYMGSLIYHDTPSLSPSSPLNLCGCGSDAPNTFPHFRHFPSLFRPMP